MNHRRKRIETNYELRNELIKKGLIIPYSAVPAWLKSRGFEEAAKAAAARRGVYLV